MPAKTASRKKAKRRPPTGMPDAIPGELAELAATLKSGGMKEVAKRFTVHKVKIPAAQLEAKDVSAIRETLGASQAVFASLLGVSPQTVKAWEQGANPLSGMAVKFISEIRDNMAHWKKKLSEGANS